MSAANAARRKREGVLEPNKERVVYIVLVPGIGTLVYCHFNNTRFNGTLYDLPFNYSPFPLQRCVVVIRVVKWLVSYWKNTNMGCQMVSTL